jgi:predicted Rossmann fold flavoprotein
MHQEGKTLQVDSLCYNGPMKIGIIGGGAAGMMAAAAIIESSAGAEVFLVEKNPGLGRKVLISGGGRCNVTTGVEDIHVVMERYPRGARFLRRAFAEFAPADVYAWFESHGVPLKTEEDMRVFPISNNGADVVGAFERVLVPPRAEVVRGRNVVSIVRQGVQFLLQYKDGGSLAVDRLILTTGGQARRYTGSTGDGYTFAEQLGHTITPLAASLNSFITAEKWPAGLSGVSFEKVKFTAHMLSNKKTHSWSGPFVFTHLGVTGPAVFALSSLVAFEDYTKEHPMLVEIDFIPDVQVPWIEELFAREREKRPTTDIKTILHKYLPWSVCETLVNEIGIAPQTHIAEISKQQEQDIIHQLKHCPLHAVGRGAGDEFVTAGGVKLSEVNPNTMQSKLCPGLFFAGELLDIDGFTGGFNLQASWATGRLAGLSAATL